MGIQCQPCHSVGSVLHTRCYCYPWIVSDKTANIAEDFILYQPDNNTMQANGKVGIGYPCQPYLWASLVSRTRCFRYPWIVSDKTANIAEDFILYQPDNNTMQANGKVGIGYPCQPYLWVSLVLRTRYYRYPWIVSTKTVNITEDFILYQPDANMMQANGKVGIGYPCQPYHWVSWYPIQLNHIVIGCHW